MISRGRDSTPKEVGSNERKKAQQSRGFRTRTSPNLGLQFNKGSRCIAYKLS